MSDNDEGIYKVDTVPPPQGEDDAYSAPTKVGVMASAIVGELLMQGQREADAPSPEAEVKTVPPPPPVVEAVNVVEATKVEVAAPEAEAEPVAAPPRVSTKPAAVVERGAEPEPTPPSNLPYLAIALVAAALLVYLLTH
jgi:hypothetical protein